MQVSKSTSQYGYIDTIKTIIHPLEIILSQNIGAEICCHELPLILLPNRKKTGRLMLGKSSRKS